LLSLQKWPEAGRLFDEVLQADDPARRWPAALGLAEAASVSGETSRAIAALQPVVKVDGCPTLLKLRLADFYQQQGREKLATELLDAAEVHGALEQKWKQFIQARILLAHDQAAPALGIFEELLRNREGGPEAMLVGATIGLADARTIFMPSSREKIAVRGALPSHPHGRDFAKL